jgi:carboxyl-terminal processing protease
MRSRRMWRKGLAVLIPAILLVLALGVGGVQESDDNLFAPVYQIYQYIRSYFYQPERIDDQQALYGAMKGVVQHLDDPYSEFLDPDDRRRFDESLQGEFSGVGIELSIVDNVLTVITPLVGTPAEAAGIRAGDQILSVDGESTEGLTLTEAALRIRGEIGTTVTLTVRHDDGMIEDIPIVRDTIVLEPVNSELRADGTIGYIRLYRFEQDTTTELDAALSSFALDDLSGFILDLRNNPGGLLNEAISVSNRFVDDGVLLITQDRLSDERKYYAKGNRIPNLPLVVLINRGTASASEITAGAIRDNNMGILIGETSFGKGVFQQLIEFPDGSSLKITAGEYFTPDRRIVNGIGLEPDIIVEEGQNPVDVAIEWIQAHAGVEMPIDLDGETAQAP